ncbi:hypothetical protein KBC70_04745 [Candidatus Woesebacteria bacterium]|nr:hypothetical protein [Candidatus Woesebacteria bacterium]
MKTEITLVNRKYFLIVSIFIALIVGLYVGRFLAYENITTNYECGRIAAFHADKLLRDGYKFDSNEGNPLSDLNQKASNLNLVMRVICSIEPKNWDPRLRPIIDEMEEKQWGRGY